MKSPSDSDVRSLRLCSPLLPTLWHSRSGRSSGQRFKSSKVQKRSNAHSKPGGFAEVWYGANREIAHHIGHRSRGRHLLAGSPVANVEAVIFEIAVPEVLIGVPIGDVNGPPYDNVFCLLPVLIGTDRDLV